MMRIRARLYVEEDLIAGQRPRLTQSQIHQLLHVLRVKPTEYLELFNGRTGSFLAEILDVGRRDVQCEVREQSAEQHQLPDLWLGFAPLKKARTDYVAQKLVEIGFAHATPVITQRTQADRFSAPKFRANMIEAAEQCAINAIPHLGDVMNLESWLQSLGTDRVVFVADEQGGGVPAAEMMGKFSDLPAGILIGPEGGFTQQELTWLYDHPAVKAVSLGPRILRADTAIVAAAAIWQSVCGDFDLRPRYNPVR